MKWFMHLRAFVGAFGKSGENRAQDWERTFFLLARTEAMCKKRNHDILGKLEEYRKKEDITGMGEISGVTSA